MLSSSVLDSAIRVEKKYSVDYSNVDNGTEIQASSFTPIDCCIFCLV